MDSGTELAAWKRQDLKAPARTVFRSNMAACAIVSVIGSVLIWPVLNLNAVITASYDFLSSAFRFFHWNEAERLLTQARQFLLDFQAKTSVGGQASAGVISSLYDMVQNAGSITRALVYAIDHAVFHNTLSTSFIAVLVFLATIATVAFVRMPLGVSNLRFYLETRLYSATPLTRLLFIYRRRRTVAIAVAGAYKLLWLVLWGLTIVMLPVKYYSYLLYDFILAENPEADPREALRVSQQLMRGQKWRVFRLDVSFALWYVLGLLTFGIVMYFYADPYHNLTRAELYMRLRDQYLARNPAGAVLFADAYLDRRPSEDELIGEMAGEAAADLYPDPQILKTDRFHWERDYSLINLVLMFFIFSFIGWVYESIIQVAYVGHVVNRGTLYGPWLPIYGVGGTLALIVLKKLRAHPLLTFLAAMVVCGIVEYVTATLIYDFTGLSYWTYKGYFFNIQGRVCLEGLLVFGLGCSAVIYLLAPITDSLLNRVPVKVRRLIAAFLVAAFLVDIGFTLFNPRVGPDLTNN